MYTAKIVAAERVTKLFRDVPRGEWFEYGGARHIKIADTYSDVNAFAMRGLGTCRIGPETPVHPLPPPTWATEPELVRFENLCLCQIFTHPEIPEKIWLKSDDESAIRVNGQGSDAFGVSELVHPIGKLEVTRGE